MDRELFQLEPTSDGWTVLGVIPDSDLYPTKLLAARKAAQLAYRYFLLTGMPTGVKVRMQCGDVVMMDLYG
jgi:hypothetical protein